MSHPGESYETLAALLERELELVRSRRLSELADLHSAQALLRDALPATPPAAARTLLDHCRDLQQRIELELNDTRETILEELRQVQRSQRAARGYKPMRTAPARITAQA